MAQNKQRLDVLLVEPAGGFVEKEQRVGCLGTGKRDGRAEPGAFAAGKVRANVAVSAYFHENFLH